MHLNKFVCGNMPGHLATFHSRNLLFCLELSLTPPKARHMRAVLPCIDAALNQTWKVQAVFFKLNCSWQFAFNVESHGQKNMLNMIRHTKLIKFDSFNVKENPSDKQLDVCPFSLTRNDIYRTADTEIQVCWRDRPITDQPENCRLLPINFQLSAHRLFVNMALCKMALVYIATQSPTFFFVHAIWHVTFFTAAILLARGFGFTSFVCGDFSCHKAFWFIVHVPKWTTNCFSS